MSRHSDVEPGGHGAFRPSVLSGADRPDSATFLAERKGRPSSPHALKNRAPGSKRFDPTKTFNSQDSRVKFNDKPTTPTKRFNPRSVFNPTAKEEPIASYSELTSVVARGQDLSHLYQPSIHPLQYHLYAPSPFRIRPALEAHQKLVEDLFISNTLREELQQRNEATLQVLPGSSLPANVHVYHSLVPLDTKIGSNVLFGHQTWKYKAVSNNDGRTYCLVRVEGFHVTKGESMAPINRWKRVSNSALVGVIEAFTTMAFGDNSLIVVYEYFPLSALCCEVYNRPPREKLLWALLAQLVNGMHAVHSASLAIRILNSRTVLVTQRDRVRINLCAICEVIDCQNGDAKELALEELQTADYNKLAELVLGMCVPNGHREAQFAAFKANFSSALVELVEYLGSDTPNKYETVITSMAPHLLGVLDQSLHCNDKLEHTLAGELENARLVRLLAKISFVLDWPESAKDPRYAPTGERYKLKLFRDYVFHQLDQVGRPSLDLVHVLSSLNKLDAGIEENILLATADDSTRLIVSFQDLKHTFEQAFRELRAPV